MARLEDLTRGAQVRGLRPDGPVTIVDAKWRGTACVELTYKDTAGDPHTELVFRNREPSLEVAISRQALSFDADGASSVSEAYRIRPTRLFDPRTRLRSLPDGRLKVTPRLADTLKVRRSILGFGPNAEVVEGISIRKRLRQKALALSARLTPSRQPLPESKGWPAGRAALELARR